MSLLIILTLCASTALSSYVVTDSQGMGRVFEGIGAISGGGATTRLLLDYADPIRSDILDYLFLPQFGASLSILKVEIGGSCDSTNGAEASHRYTGFDNGEEPNFERGYELWLISEAVKRNPSIRIYGLPWCWPAFIGNGTTDPFSPTATGGGLIAARYVTEWAVAASKIAPVWALGLWNEKSSSPAYILNLRAALDSAGMSSTQIVASDDGGWPGANQVLANASVAAAVGMLGAHYPGSSSSAAAIQTGLPLLASEDNSRSCLPGSNGGACWARVINENQAHANMTGSISWSLINSWYAGIQFYGDALMSAVQPWGGNYFVGAPIWSSAHTTHFTEPGWIYLPGGSGTGYLSGGGTYVTLVSPDHKDTTIVIEKLDRASSQCSWSSSPKNTTTKESGATFTLGGTLASIPLLYVFRSSFLASGDVDPADMFVYSGTLSPSANGGVITLSIAVNDVVTLSTRNTTKGVAPNPPPNATSFPLHYASSFDAVPLSQEPPFLSDMNGNFEVVPATPYGGRSGQVLRSMTPARPIIWLRADTTPHAILGDPNWVSVNASVEVWMPLPGDTASLATHCYGLNVDSTAGLWLRVRAGAVGSGAGGQWALFNNAGAMANASATPFASGPLDAPPAAWHTLTLNVDGAGNATVGVNGATLTTLSLKAVGAPGSGFVGLGTAAYGHFTVFDNLEISAAPAPSPPPPPPPPHPKTCPAAAAAAAAAAPAAATAFTAATTTTHGVGACTPTVGAPLITTPCTPTSPGNSFVFTPAPGSSQGTLSPPNFPALCVVTNSTHKNPQTGSPSVELQACAAGDSRQLWTPPPGVSPPGGEGQYLKNGQGQCMEVTKNEVGSGVLIETYACNGGLNQLWCGLAGGQLVTLLDGLCLGVC